MKYFSVLFVFIILYFIMKSYCILFSKLIISNRYRRLNQIRPILQLKCISNTGEQDGSYFRETSILTKLEHDILNKQTISDIYPVIVNQFYSNEISEPEASTRYLLSHVSKIGYNLSSFQSNQHKQLTIQQKEVLFQLVLLRLQHKPIQYIIGNWDFFGLELECKEPILIPRPETEELVQMVIDSKLIIDDKSTIILDIGTGTGAIGLALLSHFKYIRCHAIDVNPIAVELATLNAKKLGLDNRFHVSNISIQRFSQEVANINQYDLIVTNPPYIPSKDMPTLQVEVREYEDYAALHGGDDGLDIVKDIINASHKLLRHGSSSTLWMEVDTSHPNAIEDLLQQQSSQISVNKYHDLSKNPRFVKIKYH